MLALKILGMIGAPQIILIIAVVLLLFGGRKIPELMKGLGGGIKEFNKMNIFQKEAMAKAAGLEIGEMEKMLKGNKMKEGQEKEAEKRKNKEAKLLVGPSSVILEQ